MHEVLERARSARRDARAIQTTSLLRATEAHQRAATVARNVAAMLDRGDRRGAGRGVNVLLGFADAGCREAVITLLHELGPWEGGELVDAPDGGACFRMRSSDLALCEVAVRSRLRLALVGLGGIEDLVTVHAARPVSA